MSSLTRLIWFVSLLFIAVVLRAQNAPATKTDTKPSSQPQSPEVNWVNPSLPKGPGLQHHVLKSASLGCDVGYVVWTPPNYDAAKRYPVVYFLHGSGGTESADAAGFSGWVAKGIEKGFLPPVLVVFPNGGMSGYRGAVEKMIVDELIPLIDRNYPTIDQAEARAIAGFSMGGAGAVRLSVLHPELFAAAASLAGRAGGEADAAAEKNAAILKRRHFGFLLINGAQDSPKAFDVFSAKLKAADVQHEVVILPNLGHNLGLYYELSFEKLMNFLGAHLSDSR